MGKVKGHGLNTGKCDLPSMSSWSTWPSWAKGPASMLHNGIYQWLSRYVVFWRSFGITRLLKTRLIHWMQVNIVLDIVTMDKLLLWALLHFPSSCFNLWNAFPPLPRIYINPILYSAKKQKNFHKKH